MRLAELKADLALNRRNREYVGQTDAAFATPALIVAERVTELFEECDECAGWGKHWLVEDDRPVRQDCWRCGGAGAVVRSPGPADSMRGPDDLARFLFGEDTQ